MKKKISNIAIGIIALNCVCLVFSIPSGILSALDVYYIIFAIAFFAGIFYLIFRSTAKTNEEARALLKAMGMPFKAN